MNTLTVFLTKGGVDDSYVSDTFPTPLKARSAFLYHAEVLEQHGFTVVDGTARWTEDGSDLIEEVATLQHAEDSELGTAGWAQLVVRYAVPEEGA